MTINEKTSTDGMAARVKRGGSTLANTDGKESNRSASCAPLDRRRRMACNIRVDRLRCLPPGPRGRGGGRHDYGY